MREENREASEDNNRGAKRKKKPTSMQKTKDLRRRYDLLSQYKLRYLARMKHADWTSRSGIAHSRSVAASRPRRVRDTCAATPRNSAPGSHASGPMAPDGTLQPLQVLSFGPVICKQSGFFNASCFMD